MLRRSRDPVQLPGRSQAEALIERHIDLVRSFEVSSRGDKLVSDDLYLAQKW